MISWVERGLLTSVGSQGERNAAVVGRGIRTGLLEMETIKWVLRQLFIYAEQVKVSPFRSFESLIF